MIFHRLFMILRPSFLLVAALISGALSSTLTAQDAEHDVAYEWIEVQLKGIRTDFARPPIHARNLYHVSLGMYDAWAAYDEVSEPVLLGHTVGGYTADFDGINEMILPFLDIPLARREAASYAAYCILTHRYANSPGVVTAPPPRSRANKERPTRQWGCPSATNVQCNVPDVLDLGNPSAASLIPR